MNVIFESSNKDGKMMNRPLNIDFKLYAHNDPDFRKELIKMMVADLLELQHALQISLKLKEISFYRKTVHKTNSTLSILDDKEFIDIVEEIKSEDSREEKAEFFNRICSEILNSLEANRKDNNINVQTSNSH